MGKDFTMGPLSVTVSGPTTSSLALESCNWSGGIEVTDNRSGSAYAEGLSVTGYEPTGDVTTAALGAMLDLVGLSGACIHETNGPILAVRQYWRNLANCLSGSLSHERKNVTRGLARLISLSAQRGQDATLNVRFDAATDESGNAPISKETSVALPTTIIATRYELAGVIVGGVTFDEVSNLDIQFGVGITDKLPTFGQVAPQAFGVNEIKPRATLTGRDVSKISAALLAAAAAGATHANTSFIFKKRGVNGASWVSEATAEHILMTMAGVYVPENLGSGSGTGSASSSVVLYSHYDGTNAPWIVDTTYAISS